jgi:LacI family transcriptional regulator
MSFRVSIADVAREAGVSRQTVSRALNNKGEISSATLQRVREVIDRLDYRPSSIARGLATHHTRTIGLVVPDIANPFFADISRGADDTAQAAGYSLLLCNSVEDSDREADLLRTLEQRAVDGVVLCSSRLPDNMLAELTRRHDAVVLINRIMIGSGSVCVDDARGSVLVVEHLLRSGRRRIGLLAGPQRSYSSRERVRGYAEGMAALDSGLNPALTLRCEHPDVDGGYHAARSLLIMGAQVDALVCHNDLVAIGVLRACAELGVRVPDDVAVTGADDILLARLVTPALTTLRSDRQAIGAAALRMLLDRLHGGSDGCNESTVEPLIFRPELVVRASAP